MKYLLVFLMVISVSAFAQTNYRTVMTDTNGVLQKPTNFITTNRIVSVNTNGAVSNPTNFWTANSNSINSVISGGAAQDWTILNFASFDWINLRDSETETNNASFFGLGSSIQFQIAGTNTNGTAAVRMARFPNYSEGTGSGIRWGITNSFFVRITAFLSTNGDVVRFLLGNPQASFSNFITPLTNNGVGFEITNNSGTNQIRIISHNGSTNVNSSWINAATALNTERLNVGIVSEVGNIFLYQSKNSEPLKLATNISITNGPTNSVGTSSGAFSGGIVATNTNDIGRSLVIYDALLRATE
jgi:hypothetical protein